MAKQPPSAPEGWKHVDTVYGGRRVYENADGVELIQRPDGEWTQRPPGCPMRLELGTHLLDEAVRRVSWTSAEWAAWRAANRRKRAR